MPKKKLAVLSLIGARPQFIKIAPLASSLAKRFHHIIVNSGQHYDRMMSNIFFDQLEIPRIDHNLLVGSGTHGEMTGKIMSRFEKLLMKIRPDIVIVYGDTNTTLAGALTAVKLGIPVGHVEAGLRSYRMDMPEETNRVLTSHISSLHFCPTRQAIRNLRLEGIKTGVVHSGDLMYELVDIYGKGIVANDQILNRLEVEKRNYILLTLHRAGNVDDRRTLERSVDICRQLNISVIFPMHPRTLKNLQKFRLLNILDKCHHVKVIEPVCYLDNLSLMKNAKAVLTDSGGMQKEAVFLGTPCLTLRNETEWIETLDWGNFLVGLSYHRIIKILNNLPRRMKKVPFKIAGRKPSEIITSAISHKLEDS